MHATDATNASRTMLFDIRRGVWDAGLCELFGMPMALLPEVRDCAGEFGATGLFGGSIRIMGMAGDQQAATVGQGCFTPGMMKSTYGTGCFALLNTGAEPVASRNSLLTTMAYQLAGQRTYALEGSIFIAGAAVQWLRDALNVIGNAADADALAARADPAEHVYLVPAFVGLGAPWWDAQARGAIFGLTRKSGVPSLRAPRWRRWDIRPAICWTPCGPIGRAAPIRCCASTAAWRRAISPCSFSADILAAPVDRPVVMETTALGAAYLAGYAAGLCPDLAGFAARWKCERPSSRPWMDDEQ